MRTTGYQISHAALRSLLRRSGAFGPRSAAGHEGASSALDLVVDPSSAWPPEAEVLYPTPPAITQPQETSSARSTALACCCEQCCPSSFGGRLRAKATATS